MHYPIHKLKDDEKPREKLIKHGAQYLSEVELLAILIRSGGKEVSAIDLAREILTKFETIENIYSTDSQQLSQFKYINTAKAASIIAGLELGMRIKNNTSLVEGVTISSAQNVVDILKKEVYGKTKEHLFLVSLDARNKVIAKDLVSIGTINETLLSSREVFRQALLRNAVSIILVHNHPSDNSNPSKEDVEITKYIIKASVNIGVKFLDHIIITNSGYSSMKKEGLLNF